jgi:hypothetical protein
MTKAVSWCAPWGSLDPQQQTAMRDVLHRVLTTLAASGTHQHFGVCRDCAYLSGEMNSDSMNASRSIPECLLFGAPIEPDDAVLLCVHFQPKSERREGELSRHVRFSNRPAGVKRFQTGDNLLRLVTLPRHFGPP